MEHNPVRVGGLNTGLNSNLGQVYKLNLEIGVFYI